MHRTCISSNFSGVCRKSLGLLANACHRICPGKTDHRQGYLPRNLCTDPTCKQLSVSAPMTLGKRILAIASESGSFLLTTVRCGVVDVHDLQLLRLELYTMHQSLPLSHLCECSTIHWGSFRGMVGQARMIALFSPQVNASYLPVLYMVFFAFFYYDPTNIHA